MSKMSEQKLAEARALYVSLDRIARNPKRFSPSAPWVIPAIMIAVGSVAIICLAIKLIMKYIIAKKETNSLGSSQADSPELPTTPEDQTSMATTASMKTRGSVSHNSKRSASKHPPLSLYQMRQKQSPSSSSTRHKAVAKAMSKAARAEANKSLSKDSSKQNQDASDNDERENSPGGISQASDDTEEVIQSIDEQHSGLVYAAGIAKSGHDNNDGHEASSHSNGPQMSPYLDHVSQPPEIHIVQIREIEDRVQHFDQPWPQTESDI